MSGAPIMTLSGEALLEALRRASAGETPDDIMLEYYLDSEHYPVEGKDE